jgi:hypothetical protein
LSKDFSRDLIGGSLNGTGVVSTTLMLATDARLQTILPRLRQNLILEQIKPNFLETVCLELPDPLKELLVELFKELLKFPRQGLRSVQLEAP